MKAIEMNREDYINLEKITLMGNPSDKRYWIYRIGNDGPRVREVDIISPKKDSNPVTIVQISDLHLNMLDEQDFKEDNPTLLSTYRNRKWLANGSSEFVTRNALKYAEYLADQTVITGDALDYLSHGCAELVEKLIWEKYPDTLITAGNHEWVQRMQGEVAETLSFEQRRKWLENIWKPHHDLYYTSKIIKNKAMVIQLENALCKFWDCQIEQLENDIKYARKSNLVVLIFLHVPLWTNNKEYEQTKQIIPIVKNMDFYDFNNNPMLVGLNAQNNSPTGAVYNLITHNADIVKGIFAGHEHTDFYAEITGYSGIDGRKIMIPQYVITTCAVDPYGAAIKINVI